MTVPSTSDWTLDVDLVLTAAQERLRRGPDAAYEQDVGRRALQLLFAKFATMGINLWTVEKRTQTLTQAVADYTLDTDIQDVLEVTCRNTAEATPQDILCGRISRDEYHYIPDKTSPGAPYSHFLERLRDAPVLHVFPVPDLTTYRLDFYVIRKFRDVGGALQNLDVPTRWLGLVIAGAAYYIGLSTPGLEPDHRAELKQTWLDELEDIVPEDRDRGVLTVMPDFSAYQRY